MVDSSNEFRYRKSKRSFTTAALALGIAIVADALDYLATPLFSVPIIGDVFDVITMALLYSITKSKVSVILNLTEFIPFVGDFLPVYTVSTLIWIIREYGYVSIFRHVLSADVQTLNFTEIRSEILRRTCCSTALPLARSKALLKSVGKLGPLSLGILPHFHVP